MKTPHFNSMYYSFKCKFRTLGTNTLFKLLMAGVFLLIVSCTSKQEGYLCVACPSVALRIKLQDSQDSSKVLNAKIIAINKARNDTITVDSTYMFQWGMYDTTGQYTIYGLPGEYSIVISHPLFESFSHDGLYVSQWTEVTCEHANTENLIIALDKFKLKKKSTSKPSGIISQRTDGHC